LQRTSTELFDAANFLVNELELLGDVLVAYLNVSFALSESHYADVSAKIKRKEVKLAAHASGADLEPAAVAMPVRGRK